MEFEDMQAIWSNQEEEKLYAINDKALYAAIRRKGQSVTRKVRIFEGLMTGVNLVVGLLLLVDAVRDNNPGYAYVLPALYLAYALAILIRRLFRRQEAARFEATMLGELDKALWQIDYLIQQSRRMVIWYVLPLMLVGGVTILLNAQTLWALGFLVLMILLVPATYFGSRWEINRFYLPKRRALESLRETLLAPPSTNPG